MSPQRIGRIPTDPYAIRESYLPVLCMFSHKQPLLASVIAQSFSGLGLGLGSIYISGGWLFLKWGRKDCALGCHWPACTVGAWWHKNVRLKLFQGVLVNYKIVGRDSYLNKIDTKPSVASLLFESWWTAHVGDLPLIIHSKQGQQYSRLLVMLPVAMST